MDNIQQRRRCLPTCDQGKGQGGLDVPFQLQVTKIPPGLGDIGEPARQGQ